MSKKGYWLNSESRKYLAKDYLAKGETPEKRIRDIADAAEKILVKMAKRNGKTGEFFKGYADKLEDYILRGWFSLSSPIWSNFGKERGLPISCNNSHISDNTESILYKSSSEIGMMSKFGAGTSAYLGDIRPRGAPINKGGGLANGPVHYARIIDTVTDVISQSSVRRGSCAVYLPVEHPDIMEFLQIRSEGHPIQRLSFGVTITDDFMESVAKPKAESSDLDMQRKAIFAKIVETRYSTGYPYIMFHDTVNKNAPKAYKDNDKIIKSSNLCSEIALCSDEKNSFVCDLSSKNILHYDEWKDTDSVKILTYLLDAVMEEYIEKTANMPEMAAAHNFAKNERALGVGVLGWHSFLQSKMIPFESFDAQLYNVEIHKFIYEQTQEATRELYEQLGTSEFLEPYKIRNVTTCAIAPTTSSSYILGQVSPGIEPLCDNYFVKDLAKTVSSFKNPYLEKLLEDKDKNSVTVWNSILKHGGSVQHLDFLSDEEKAVFRTFGEISQYEIITQAAHRQKYIDQSQSLNLMIDSNEPCKNTQKLIVSAWKMGVKTLYYQRGTNPSQQLSRNILSCKSCEA